MRKATPTRQLGSRTIGDLLPGYLFLLLVMMPFCRAQSVDLVPAANSGIQVTRSGINPHGSSSAAVQNDDDEPAALAKWQGLPVREISFQGVSADRLQPLPAHLPQEMGAPLDREKVAESLRALFASGLFTGIEAHVTRQGDGVNLVFQGTPREFIGTINVDGAKGATINAQLVAASRLTATIRATSLALSAASLRVPLMRPSCQRRDGRRAASP